MQSIFIETKIYSRKNHFPNIPIYQYTNNSVKDAPNVQCPTPDAVAVGTPNNKKIHNFIPGWSLRLAETVIASGEQVRPSARASRP